MLNLTVTLTLSLTLPLTLTLCRGVNLVQNVGGGRPVQGVWGTEVPHCPGAKPR